MRLIGALLIVISIMACTSKKTTEPQKHDVKIIPQKKLVHLIVNYHLAEAVNNSPQFREAFKKIDAINLTDSVLSEAGYTRKDLDSSLNYYSGDPAAFDDLYDKVLTELSRIEAEQQKQQLEEQKKKKK